MSLTTPYKISAPNAYRLINRQVRKFLIRMQKESGGINWKIHSTLTKRINSKKNKFSHDLN